MPIQVIMPQLGESVDEGTISKWLINIGDEIKEYDPLLEINTDKVDSEIGIGFIERHVADKTEPVMCTGFGVFTVVIGDAPGLLRLGHVLE